jgi:hypothetical protein
VATKQSWRRRHADPVTASRKRTLWEGRAHKQTWRVNNAKVFASTPAATHQPITRMDVKDETRPVPTGASKTRVVPEATQNIYLTSCNRILLWSWCELSHSRNSSTFIKPEFQHRFHRTLSWATWIQHKSSKSTLYRSIFSLLPIFWNKKFPFIRHEPHTKRCFQQLFIIVVTVYWAVA